MCKRNEYQYCSVYVNFNIYICICIYIYVYIYSYMCIYIYVLCMYTCKLKQVATYCCYHMLQPV